jgi:hypothetical protein
VSKINAGDYSDATGIDEITQLLSFNILNDLQLGTTDIRSYCSTSSSAVADEIADLLDNNGPVIAKITSHFGYSSVLITSIYQSMTDSTKFYIGFYDPMVPGEIQYATMTTMRGVNYATAEVGWAIEFDYDSDIGIVFDGMEIFNNISVSSDEETLYSVMQD